MRNLQLIAVVVATLSAAPALAQEATTPEWASKKGSFGLGANTTLGGINGINLRTYFTPSFGINATLGFGYTAESRDDAGAELDRTVTDIRASLYGSYKLAYWQRGGLSALFGLDLRSLSSSDDDGSGMTVDTSATTFGFGAGLAGEFFLTNHLSLFAGVGLVADFLGPAEVAINDGQPVEDVSGFALGLAPDLWGQAGFTVWFN